MVAFQFNTEREICSFADSRNTGYLFKNMNAGYLPHAILYGFSMQFNNLKGNNAQH